MVMIPADCFSAKQTIHMLIQILLIIAALYLACGVMFMIPFIIKGVDVIDEGAHGSSIGFRIIIIPGVIVFWIVLLKKWITRKRNDASGTGLPE
jgi:hypothetical protein